MRAIAVHTRYGLVRLVRSPVALFFTLAFPLGFYLLFASLLPDEAIQGLTANILLFSVVTGSYTALAINTVEDREDGVLKRLRGTPLAPWRYLVSQTLVSVVLAAVAAVMLVVLGIAAFGLELEPRLLPAAALIVLLGTATLCLLGLATTVIIPGVEAASGVTNAVVFPLLFASGIFFPLEQMPGWLTRVAALFPLLPLGRALRATFDPGSGEVVAWTDLGLVALWALAGLLLAARFFRWQPRTAGGRPRRRRPRGPA